MISEEHGGLSIEALFAQARNDADRAQLLNRKAWEIEEIDPVQMLVLARRAREFASRAGDRVAWAYACRHAGIAHYMLAHAMDALADLQAGLDQFEELGHREGIALVVGNMAVVYQDAGRYDLALDCQLRCTRLCEELGDEQGKARSLLNGAEIYCSLNKEDRALDYCEQSLALARKWDDRHTLGTALANIGTVYARLGKLDRALACQQEALAIKEESGNTRGIAIGLSNIAALRAASDETEQALGMYELSLQLRRDTGDKRGEATVLRSISELCARLGKHDAAIQYAARALALARELKLSLVEAEAHAVCARSYEAMGDITAAYRHLKSSVALHDAGMATSQITHVAALVLEYDRKYDHDAHELLRHRVFDLEHTALRSQTNPHFLFNALNSIQFFLTNNDRESAHRYLAKLGRLMRATLESARSPLVTLAHEIETVRLYLALEQLRFGERFIHRVDVDAALVAEEIMVPPMLLQPFIENAVWHGLLPRSNAGSIDIAVKPLGDDSILCVIEDDGIGRVESARLRAASATAEKHVSLGMTLVSDRLALLRDRTGREFRATVHDLYRDGGVSAGTRVEIVLPMSLRLDDLL